MSETPHNAQVLKGKTGLQRIFRALGYSRSGLCAAYRGEAAFRQLVWLNCLLIPIACLLNVSGVERALLILVPLLSLMVELLNSAIEAAIDRISLELHPLSKQAKDMGSAAQLIALCATVSTWLCVLL